MSIETSPTPAGTHRSRVTRGASALGLVAVSLALTGCSAFGTPGTRVTEEREISGATAVLLATDGDLTIEVGDEPGLTITAGENVMDRLTSDVVDGELRLDMRERRWGRHGDIEYRLVLPRTERIAVDGSGDVLGDLGAVDDLQITVDGSGDVEASGLDLDGLDVDIDGSGRVTLAGSAGRQHVAISGSGSFDGHDLVGDDGAVLLSGSGDAAVHVVRTLAATVDGSGSVRHTGGAEVTSTVSGSGDVVPD
ncbi:MAG: hypothetical protein JWP95_1461 [Actinotalea sp.]|nr:hypothetical protein [Actinotalea sp.]